jgi:hypothetical protein
MAVRQIEDNREMVDPLARPFESIESSQEFMVVLEEAIQGAISEVTADMENAKSEQQDRRVEALHLALFKMGQLSMHVHKSRRVLNDLRVIRRLLLSERAGRGTTAAS